MTKTQLIVCGSIALDRIMNFSGKYTDMIHPEKLHVLSVSILLDKLENTPGGVGANIAHNSALLGDSPILYGSVGPDATVYMQKLSDEGVQTEFVHKSKLPTATFNVITDSDHNQVGGFYSGAMSDSKSLSLKQWTNKDVFVTVSAHDPTQMASQVAESKNLGIRLMYDPGQQVSNVPVQDLVAGIDTAELLMLNDYEFGVVSKLTGKTEAEIKAIVPVVVTTLGKNGSVIESSSVKSPINIDIAQPDQAVDPSGAGDAYRAGFLYGYLRKWELLKCGQLGATVASFAVEQHGTQVDLSLPEIIKRYQKTFNEEIEL